MPLPAGLYTHMSQLLGLSQHPHVSSGLQSSPNPPFWWIINTVWPVLGLIAWFTPSIDFWTYLLLSRLWIINTAFAVYLHWDWLPFPAPLHILQFTRFHAPGTYPCGTWVASEGPSAQLSTCINHISIRAAPVPPHALGKLSPIQERSGLEVQGRTS